jgi:eukaryotic-like serine/threonine-protein kinase
VNGDLTLTYTGHSTWVNEVTWSPINQQIASASDDMTVQLWNAITGETVLTYRGHTGWVYAVSWSPDGKSIASAGEDGTVQMWDVT